jgi:hypothetical protein
VTRVSVAIAGILGKCDSITQQDAPHKNKRRRMRCTWHLAHLGRRGMNMLLVGKPERERPRGRHEHGWEDNIRMDVRVIGWGMD